MPLSYKPPSTSVPLDDSPREVSSQILFTTSHRTDSPTHCQSVSECWSWVEKMAAHLFSPHGIWRYLLVVYNWICACIPCFRMFNDQSTNSCMYASRCIQHVTSITVYPPFYVGFAIYPQPHAHVTKYPPRAGDHEWEPLFPNWVCLLSTLLQRCIVMVI